MPDWKNIIVGDAFKLPSKSPRYYFDLALFFPILVSMVWFIVSIWAWPPSRWDVRGAAIAGYMLLVCFALTRAKLVMVGGLFGYILVRGAIGLTITDTTNQLALLAIVVIAAAGLYVLLWFGKKKTDDPYKSVHPLFDRTISIIALVAVVMLLVQVYITSFR